MEQAGNERAIRFNMYEMEYQGGAQQSALSPVTFEEKYFDRYRRLHIESFYAQRAALDIRPYDLFYERLEDLMEQKDSIFLLLDRDVLIGTVSCIAREIDRLAVNAAYRRQGYGRKMMTFALAHMQKQGHAPIKLAVTKWNKNAALLYTSLGFAVTKEAVIEGVNTQNEDGGWTFRFTDTGGLDIR